MRAGHLLSDHQLQASCILIAVLSKPAGDDKEPVTISQAAVSLAGLQMGKTISRQAALRFRGVDCGTISVKLLMQQTNPGMVG